MSVSLLIERVAAPAPGLVIYGLRMGQLIADRPGQRLVHTLGEPSPVVLAEDRAVGAPGYRSLHDSSAAQVTADRTFERLEGPLVPVDEVRLAGDPHPRVSVDLTHEAHRFIGITGQGAGGDLLFRGRRHVAPSLWFRQPEPLNPRPKHPAQTRLLLSPLVRVQVSPSAPS